MSEHTGHRHPRFIRKVYGDGDPVGVPDGCVVPLVGVDEVPDGWEVIHEREGRFIPGPAPEGTRRFGEISEADAMAAFKRFMGGESALDLAHAYCVPVGVIEEAIRLYAPAD